MITIRRIAPDDANLLRDLRLRALADTPLAFGSTLARELAFDPDEWLRRSVRLSSAADAATFFAFEEDRCCGIIGGFWRSDDPGTVMVVSMWVAPEARRRGVGAKLMHAVEDWARQQGQRRLMLEVVETNAAAIAFYQSCGFQFTGEMLPYPNDARLRERVMTKPLVVR